MISLMCLSTEATEEHSCPLPVFGASPSVSLNQLSAALKSRVGRGDENMAS